MVHALLYSLLYKLAMILFMTLISFQLNWHPDLKHLDEILGPR